MQTKPQSADAQFVHCTLALTKNETHELTRILTFLAPQPLSREVESMLKQLIKADAQAAA